MDRGRDARLVDLGDARFDLIVMTGNVFQLFLTDDDARTVLAMARRHLASGGRLTFETREPRTREWEGWTPGATRKSLRVQGIGNIEVYYAFLEQRGELITFETRHAFPDGSKRSSPSTLRLRTREQVAYLLVEAGFDEVEWWSDWRRTPLTDEALEIVPIAHVLGEETGTVALS